MVTHRLLKDINPTNLFKILCFLVFVDWLYEELKLLLVTRPTQISEKQIKKRSSDVPDIFLCLNKGYDINALRDHGYSSQAAYGVGIGFLNNKAFVGWSGLEEKTLTSSRKKLCY